jgi:hypothetical protein
VTAVFDGRAVQFRTAPEDTPQRKIRASRALWWTMRGTGRRRLRGLAATGIWMACALGVPAGAGAGPVDDACRGNDGPASLCVGLEKVGERGSAECRRPGIASDEQCANVPAGHRVVRSEVDEHESSDVHRRLALQYELGGDVPFANAPWLGTHNSFNSPDEFPTLSHTDSNQQLSLVDQLRLDMRKLEIDVHWFRSARAGGDLAPVVCHARGAGEMHAGCTTERLLSETMAPVAAWLNDHPGQVLLLYVEDHLEPASLEGAAAPSDGHAEAARVLEETFVSSDGSRSLVYHPPAGAGCAPLPLSASREDVLAAGAQVVIVSGCDGDAGWRGAIFDWSSSHEESGQGGYACPAEGGAERALYDSTLIRRFEDATWLSAMAGPGGEPYYEDGITAATAAEMTRCGVDLIDFDQILPADPRLEAVTWSWTAGQPGAAGRCAAQASDGGWHADDCAAPRRAACRAADGTWSVTAVAERFRRATARCAELGATFAVPRNGRENDLLRQAREAEPGDVWLAHRRVDGRWVALDAR